jgi:uncharacterized protein (TIGR00375 family)
MATYFADLHIHSKYSRACSTSLDIKNLEKYAKIKGINFLGTGDFTHPKWITELKQNLKEKDGICYTKSEFPFVLQSEISLIYSQGGKGRRIHLVMLAPSFEVVDQITEYLLSKGRVDYDGRPIFGIPCPDFVERLKEIDESIEIIAAHIWTPYFGLFGSKSGFDSVKECFDDQTKHIHALETGISSDPEMNWQLSDLDKYTLVSNSDLHSFWPWRIGRECNQLELKHLTYKNLIHAIRTREGFVQTIEFWPDEGKYHYDGHRACNICFSPEESKKHNNICPVCKKPLTIGVLNRVRELADREKGFVPKDAVPFRNLIPLSELIAKRLGSSVASKKVWEEYNKIMKPYSSEFDVLFNATKEQLDKLTHPKIAEIIVLNRLKGIPWNPGYDGVYGEPVIEPIDGIKPAKVRVADDDDICTEPAENQNKKMKREKTIKKVMQKSLGEF